MDADGFDEAFVDLFALSRRVAFRILGEQAPAEDVAAETLARAYARWPKVSEHARAWCVTVATNLALDVARRRVRERSQAHLLVDLEATADPQVELRLDLRAALESLPRRQRAVVALRYLGDVSEAETAAALGIEVGTVKSTAAKGLVRLRAAMGRGGTRV